MKSYKLFIFLSIVCLTSCSVQVQTNETHTSKSTSFSEPQNPKNIIFMVGDGMGLSQITAGMLRNESLNLERIKHIGLSKTRSAKELITDSAAGATAFSIGEKTYNGAIGVDVNKMPKETILETLANQGYSTGIIATCNITHATPASFFAHQPQRKMYFDIAEDLVQAPVSAFIAGGKVHFTREENEELPSIMSALENNYSMVNGLQQFKNTKGKVGYFYSSDHPESVLKGREDILPQSIQPMINHLQSETDKGFFMLVEGSQIDWGGHANDSEYIITEMIDFDKAIGKVLDFAEKDGNTLVVITADHETGGYALNSKENNYVHIEETFTTGGHTGVMVPVFAYGPGAEQFQGIYDNHQIYHKIRKALNR